MDTKKTPLSIASALTYNYLKILEERLYVEWDDKGKPNIPASKINIFTLQRIRMEISDLFNGNDVNSAIDSTAEYGKKHVQTVGFGLIEDFDTFIKLGFLCGERIVLWDFLWGRILSDTERYPKLIPLVIEVATNLVKLIPIASDGGIILLPYPTEWHEKTNYDLANLYRSGHYTPANQGLVASLSANEVIPLHPYTSFSSPWPNHPEELANHERYSYSHYLFQQMVDSLFYDEKFNYLLDISLAEFYNNFVSSKNVDGIKFYDQLKQYLGLGSERLSPQEALARIEDKRKNFAKEIDSRNKRVVRSSIVRAGASLAVVSAIGTLLNSYILKDPKSTIALAMVGAGTALLDVLSNALDKSDHSIVVQAFYDAKTILPGVNPNL